MGKVSLGYIYIICGGFRRIEYIIQLKYSNSSDVFLMYNEQPQPVTLFLFLLLFHYMSSIKRMLFCPFAILKYEKSFEY
jgi:hypothetical protein